MAHVTVAGTMLQRGVRRVARATGKNVKFYTTMKTNRRNISKFKGFKLMKAPRIKLKPVSIEFQATPEQWSLFEEVTGHDLAAVPEVLLVLIFEGGKQVMIRFHNPKRLFWNN